MFNYVGGGLIYVRDAGACARCALAGVVAEVLGFGVFGILMEQYGWGSNQSGTSRCCEMLP